MPIHPVVDPVPLRPARVPRSLRSVAGAFSWLTAIPDVSVTGISLDSRRVRPGDLYCALPGANTHGAHFASNAITSGAVAIVTDLEGEALVREALGEFPVLVAPDPRARVGRLASEIYGNPSHGLKIIGITGTDGKTTTAMLAEAGLREAGYSTGLVGTISTRIGDQELPSVRTTPEAPDLHALLAVMIERGVEAVAMEVSSHAIALGRVTGIEFDVVVFTNLGHDHLDFHHSQERYFGAKAELFTPTYARQGLVCVDDDWGRRLSQSATIPVRTFSVPTVGDSPVNPADWSVRDLEINDAGWRFDVLGPTGTSPAGCRLPGLFNVRNALAAIAACEEIGAPLELASLGVSQCAAVPGRMQSINEGSGVAVVVDYAHTPDALERALGVGRELAGHRGGRLLALLGCGGDRDRDKRPLMGEVAARLADVVVLTDDNPRSENPAQIRREMMVGVERVPATQRALVRETAGREEALREVVRMADSNDVVLALGKGHETTQEINGVFRELDDRVVLAAAISELRT